jgi:hypothetical protein
VPVTQRSSASPYCNCPRCVTAAGFGIMRSELDDVALTVGTMMDLLERHYAGDTLLRMQMTGLLIMDSLGDAYEASRMLEKRLAQTTKGQCRTMGVKTLPAPSGQVLRSN